MSYILDALNKSEYEREHGGVPGLKADHHFSSNDNQKKPWLRYSFIFVVGVTLVLIAILFYTGQLRFMVGKNQLEEPKSGSPDSVVLENVAMSKQSISMSNGTKTQNPIVEKKIAEQAVVNNIAKIPEPATIQDKPVSSDPGMRLSKQALPEHINKNIVRKSINNPLQDKKQATAPAELQKSVSPATGRTLTKSTASVINKEPIVEPKVDSRDILSISQLPDAVQRSLPDLKYSGHLYSSNPLRRKLIINGRSMREGDWVNNDLRLDEVTMSGAVFSYKEYYYQVELLRNWSDN